MRLVKVLGWIFVPYIMVIVRWRKTKWVLRVLGVSWAVFVGLVTLGAMLAPTPPTARVASVSTPQSLTTSTPHSSHALAPLKKPTKKRTSVKKPVPIKKSSPAQTAALQKTQAAAKAKQAIQADWTTLLSYPPMGHSHAVGHLSVTVNSINQYPSVGSGSFGVTANGMFWAVSITVRNNDTTSRIIDASMFQIVAPSAPGKPVYTYSPSSSADLYANAGNNFLLSSLNPGVSMTGLVVFDMPAKYPASLMELFHLNVTSGIGLFNSGTQQNFSFMTN